MPAWCKSFKCNADAIQPFAAANPAIALRLQSWRPVGRVAELGSLGLNDTRQRSVLWDGDPGDRDKKRGEHCEARQSRSFHRKRVPKNCSISRLRKLDVTGKLNSANANDAGCRRQNKLLGKAQCAACHQPPYYTDNLMHNLKLERFFKRRLDQRRRCVRTARPAASLEVEDFRGCDNSGQASLSPFSRRPLYSLRR